MGDGDREPFGGYRNPCRSELSVRRRLEYVSIRCIEQFWVAHVFSVSLGASARPLSEGGRPVGRAAYDVSTNVVYQLCVVLCHIASAQTERVLESDPSVQSSFDGVA